MGEAVASGSDKTGRDVVRTGIVDARCVGGRHDRVSTVGQCDRPNLVVTDGATQGELGCCPLQAFYRLVRGLHVVRSILHRCSTDCHARSGACTGVGFDRDPHGETTVVRSGQNASIVGDRVSIGIV